LRARRLAQRMGLSENRLYSDLIQEGLLVREQMAYLEKLRNMRVTTVEGLRLLELAPDNKPDPVDVLPKRILPRAGRKKPPVPGVALD
jgi:hypothetical protein